MSLTCKIGIHRVAKAEDIPQDLLPAYQGAKDFVSCKCKKRQDVRFDDGFCVPRMFTLEKIVLDDAAAAREAEQMALAEAAAQREKEALEAATEVKKAPSTKPVPAPKSTRRAPSRTRKA